MRRPSRTAEADRQVADPLKEEWADAWQPDRISDRKLQELATRLESVQRLGGSFAKIALAPELQARLDQQLASRS